MKINVWGTQSIECGKSGGKECVVERFDVAQITQTQRCAAKRIRLYMEDKDALL